MSSAGLVVSRIPGEEFVLSPHCLNEALGMGSDESILIFLSLAGNTIPMRILGSDSIQSLKLKIQTFNGFVVKNQKLVCGGRELSRNNSAVRDYGVSDGNVLHLVLRLSDLQLIKVQTVCGKELTFHVDRCRNVGYVKKQIAKKGRGIVDVEDSELICDGEPLQDQKKILDICKSNDAVIHLFVRRSATIRAKPVEKNFELSVDASKLSSKKYDEVADGAQSELLLVVPKPFPASSQDLVLEAVIVNRNIEIPSSIKDLIRTTLDGLIKGFAPVRSSEGSGGAYMMPDSAGHEYVSVFKPMDEEPKAVNNPQGLPLSLDGEGLKRGTRVGEGAIREAAVYILDHPRSGRRAVTGDEMGFSGVPPTGLVRCLHSGFNHPKEVKIKIGSLQKFVKNSGSCEDMGPRDFPVEEVHKISVLDIRLANADRHSGNILLRKDEETGHIIELIPIDHGYCLPESFEDCTFDWLYWPQARQPYSSDTIEYIRSLDAEEDIALLKLYGWDMPVDCARVLRVSTMLLKKGVERGLTPFAIGSIMCRETIRKESVIEEILQEALDSVLPGSSEQVFLETVAQIMDRKLDQAVAK